MRSHNNKSIAHLAPLAAAVAAAILSTSALAVDFHGYSRAGLSSNVSNGGEQTCLGNGGDGHFVGRLADECDTYGELALGQELYNKDNQTFRFDSMLAYNVGHQGNDYQALDGSGNVIDATTNTKASSSPWQGGEMALRQAYVSGNNVIDSLPGATLWVGKRYYQRQDIHQLDLFYLSDSGYGGGVENMAVGSGKLSAAIMNSDTPGSIDGKQDNTIQNNKLDLRYSFPVGNANLELVGIYGWADLNKAQKDAGVTSNNGFFLTAVLSNAIMNGTNKVVLQYGKDSMGNNAFNNAGGGESLNAPGNDANLKQSWRLIDFGVVSVANNTDLGYSALYQKGKTWGAVTEQNPDRVSVVLRPVYNWTTVMSTAIEVGYDNYHAASSDKSQDLEKVAIAQQWAAGPGYWIRPVIRAYVASFWGDQADNAKSANPDGESGDIRVGLQMEAWW